MFNFQWNIEEMCDVFYFIFCLQLQCKSPLWMIWERQTASSTGRRVSRVMESNEWLSLAVLFMCVSSSTLMYSCCHDIHEPLVLWGRPVFTVAFKKGFRTARDVSAAVEAFCCSLRSLTFVDAWDWLKAWPKLTLNTQLFSFFARKTKSKLSTWHNVVDVHNITVDRACARVCVREIRCRTDERKNEWQI